MPRKYTKKNKDYWSNLSRGNSESENKSENKLLSQAGFQPEMFGESLYDSKASRLDNPSGRTKTRKNKITGESIKDKYNNIDDGMLPFEYSKDKVDVRDAILLAQKAYFNISVVKSTIDLLSEFANSDIYLKGGNESSRKFIRAWFKKINIHDLKEQGFREYFRSGDVFFYELTARPSFKSIKDFDLAEAASNARIPVKYILLNPYDVIVTGSLSFGEYQYAKALTPFEISRLKTSKDPRDKEIYNSLSPEVKKQIDEKGPSIMTNKEILLELNPQEIHTIFYKKQDYEPLSVPLIFPVLDDINKKMELKKVDQAIARSIENVILLITMGAEPEKGGVNHANVAAMRELFQNNSVGRVLVSDYTTEGEWLLPDLRKVIGKEKYEVLNKDIEDGLNNILLGESKYSDTEFKLKIFFQRLEEARGRFLKDFLQKEIERTCKAAGFRDVPVAYFSKKDIMASESLQKLTTRMMELGVLTPEQGMEVIHKGDFPKPEEMRDAQETYKEDREEGYYMPIVSSNIIYEHENMEDIAPDNNNVKKPVDKNGQRRGVANPRSRKPATTSAPSGGRPVGTASEVKYSVNKLMEVTNKIQELQSKAESMYKKKLGVRSLKKEQKELIPNVCASVVVGSDYEQWEEKVQEVVNNASSLLSINSKEEILSIAAFHGLEEYPAALLYHSNLIK